MGDVVYLASAATDERTRGDIRELMRAIRDLEAAVAKDDAAEARRPVSDLGFLILNTVSLFARNRALAELRVHASSGHGAAALHAEKELAWLRKQFGGNDPSACA